MSFILSLLALWIMGFCLVSILFRKNSQELSWVETFSLSYFMGIGVVTCQLFIYYLLGIKFDLCHVIWLPVFSSICVLVCILMKKNKKEIVNSAYTIQNPWLLIEKIILGFIVLQVCWIFYLVWPFPVDSYDALASYAFKAKIFYLNQGIPAGFFNWGEMKVTHPDYPLMLPFFMTWVYIFTGFNDVLVIKIVPITLIFFLFLFYSQLKRFFNRTYALWALFLICTLRQIVNYVTIIHADFFLLAFATAAFLYFMRYMVSLNRLFLLIASIMFAFTLLLKSEGMIFTFSYLLCLAIFVYRSSLDKKNRIKDLCIALLTILLIAGPWFLLKFSKHMVNSDVNLSLLSFPRFFHNMTALPVILNEFQKQVFGIKKWIFFWMGILLTLILMYRRLFKGRNFYSTLFLLTCVAWYVIGYGLFTSDTVFYYANKTMSRFIIHLAGLYLFLAMCLVWEKDNELK
jgi:hypothetical protein